MTQRIDPVKLKAAAEHLEWVLMQYPNDAVVQDMLDGLAWFIEDAKSGNIHLPVARIPFGYQFGDGVYMPYRDPDVGGAYANFSMEIRGGLSEADEVRLARIQSMLDVANESHAR